MHLFCSDCSFRYLLRRPPNKTLRRKLCFETIKMLLISFSLRFRRTLSAGLASVSSSLRSCGALSSGFARWSRRLPLHSKVFLNSESFLLLKNMKGRSFCTLFKISRYGAKQRRKPYCSCSATHFVAKTCLRKLRVSLACGKARQPRPRKHAIAS